LIGPNGAGKTTLIAFLPRFPPPASGSTPLGGLARVDDAALPIPPDLVCAQYPRLDATGAWLARSFVGPSAGRDSDCNAGFAAAVAALRRRLTHWALASPRERESWLRKLQFYERLQDESDVRFRVLAVTTRSEHRARNLLALAASVHPAADALVRITPSRLVWWQGWSSGSGSAA